MKYYFQILSLFLFSQIFNACSAVTTSNNDVSTFEIVSETKKTTILYNKDENSLDSIAAYLLADDIYKVSKYKPTVITNIKEAKGNVIVIGALGTKFIETFLKDASIKNNFEHQWESYMYKTISNPKKNIEKALIIAGTNPRGTAYGVFDLSKKLGVSPWYWWADVPAKQQSTLVINQPEYYSKAPSVEYRGIFLNDEDWGLQPWAAKTLEPETGDIGPKTYAKIFELLLRLKANAIWPAMHSSTKAFFHYPGNRKMAELYQIVLGSSHAEPMLRNNVDEWNKQKWGRFNYKTNKQNVFKYWEDRVKEASNIDGIYTIGMRGVHDSGMEGVKSKAEAVEVLTEVIADQRGMLQKHINPDVTKIPQAFTVYKEVLDIYKNGLKVPEDITLVWTDDNYGYIRALSNVEEQQRVGGSGVYYHVSYWGRPHDYLWLDTTNPYLVREEMMKAYELNNRKIWILNVGDIKPAEYNMQFFLDMAFDAEQFKNPLAVKKHEADFYGGIFGTQYANDLAAVKESYFQLAFERKPEFMGWSQTERTTPIYKSAYNALSNGDEMQQRIDAYQKIEDKVVAIQQQLPENLQSAFTQLIAYPVNAAANMSKKFMYKDKALTYQAQSRKSASLYKELSHKAYEEIVNLTAKYNEVSNGKWREIMDMKPRRLPVFDNPEIELKNITSHQSINISVEDTLAVSKEKAVLPTFYVNQNDTYFMDVFLVAADQANWKVAEKPNWLTVSKEQGSLNETTLEQRIFASINWQAWKVAGSPKKDVLLIKGDDFNKTIEIHISDSYQNNLSNTVVEKNGKAVFYASQFQENASVANKFWELSKGLGHSSSVMHARPLSAITDKNVDQAPVLTYQVYTETVTKNAYLNIVAIPTHPLHTDGEVRIAVQWNDEPLQEINFKTYGRSREWKQNVLTNKAIKQIKVPVNFKGKQQLKIFMVDAGVMLDYIVLNTKDTKIPYHLGKQTIID
ncbi:glycosyl hydrolase 115 family protein [Wenyingzhuangia sp. IMCC45467]